ncbi:MAG: DUF1573 domain-containing protein [Bacteroidota bacterium]
MKHLPILLLLPLLVLSCTAQQEGGARLVVEDNATHSFGTITHSDRPEHRFVLRNTSEDTVRITSVKASCGCTAAVVSGGTLPPGGTSTVDVKFTPPRSTNGHVAKTISVYTEGDPQKQYLLRIDAEIRSAFTVSPEKIEMGTLITRNVATTTLRLTNASSDTQRIVDIQGALAVENRGYDGTQPPQVLNIDEVKSTPHEFTLAPGESQDITVSFFPIYEGKLMGSLVIYAGPETHQVEFFGTLRRP